MNLMPRPVMHSQHACNESAIRVPSLAPQAQSGHVAWVACASSRVQHHTEKCAGIHAVPHLSTRLPSTQESFTLLAASFFSRLRAPAMVCTKASIPTAAPAGRLDASQSGISGVPPVCCFINVQSDDSCCSAWRKYLHQPREAEGCGVHWSAASVKPPRNASFCQREPSVCPQQRLVFCHHCRASRACEAGHEDPFAFFISCRRAASVAAGSSGSSAVLVISGSSFSAGSDAKAARETVTEDLCMPKHKVNTVSKCLD
jgi:hypothetical protein